MNNWRRSYTSIRFFILFKIISDFAKATADRQYFAHPERAERVEGGFRALGEFLNKAKAYRGKWAYLLITLFCMQLSAQVGLPLFWWKHQKFINFGDHLSLKLVERIVGLPIQEAPKDYVGKKLLAIGSIMSFAQEGDVVWGSGIKRGDFYNITYNFKYIDVRAVRGPLSREFLTKQLHVSCPEIYGDPALLLPYFFPEFKRSKHSRYEYIIIPHYSEQWLFPKDVYPQAVYPTDPWDEVVQKILDSKFVIAGSLHGIIVAEAFGVPARLLRRCTKDEPLFKYQDYYLGTQRVHFTPACSIEQALEMGGEKRMRCDLKKLYEAFPFDYWLYAKRPVIEFPALEENDDE